VLWFIPTVYIPGIALRLFNILRLLRLLLIMIGHIERIAFAVRAMSTILRGAASVSGCLFLMVYAWSILGVHLYGGLIYAGQPRLAGSALFTGNYDVLNFNDLASGFLPLLSSFVTGGVLTGVISGIGLVNAAGLAGSTAFFFSFYYLGVYVVFNVFVSFIIDGLMSDNLAASIQADAKQGSSKLESFYEQLRHAPEAGFDVVVEQKGGQDAVYQHLFADELDSILHPEALDDAASSRRRACKLCWAC